MENYTRINFENNSTKLNASNLNRLDKGLYDVTNEENNRENEISYIRQAFRTAEISLDDKILTLTFGDENTQSVINMTLSVELPFTKSIQQKDSNNKAMNGYMLIDGQSIRIYDDTSLIARTTALEDYAKILKSYDTSEEYSFANFIYRYFLNSQGEAVNVAIVNKQADGSAIIPIRIIQKRGLISTDDTADTITISKLGLSGNLADAKDYTSYTEARDNVAQEKAEIESGKVKTQLETTEIAGQVIGSGISADTLRNKLNVENNSQENVIETIKFGSNSLEVSDKIVTVTKAILEDVIQNATQSTNGLLSSTDKAHLDSLYAALITGDSSIESKIDTINEVYTFLADYSKENNLAALLNSKLNKSSISVSGTTLVIDNN